MLLNIYFLNIMVTWRFFLHIEKYMFTQEHIMNVLFQKNNYNY